MHSLTQQDKEKILDLKKKYSVYAPWNDSKLFHKIINALSEPFSSSQIDKVVGIEARGFILGGAVAYKLNSGFVVARKGGSMYKKGYSQDDVLREKCLDYSEKEKTLEMEKNAIQKGDNAIIIDDWFDKGSQGQATIRLIEKAGGTIVGIGIMIDQMTDQTKNSFSLYNLHSLLYLKPGE